MSAITIYDTTLRDGTQGEGVSISAEDAVKIALRLDKFGVDYIEGGWPGSNPKHQEFFQLIKNQTMEKAKIVAFSATRKPGITAQEDSNLQSILDAGVKVAALFGKSWDFHVTEALKTTLDENINMIYDSISYLVGKGLEVIYDAEHFFDGYKRNREYALKTITVAQDAGAGIICLCDTNGGTMPWEVKEIVSDVVSRIKTPVGIHAHNDCDLAVANTLMAVEAGAVQVQGTINGYGERCGNVNLCSVIPNLKIKMGHDVVTDESLQHLTELSHYVSELANMVPNPHMPFVGNSAYAHKAGIHVSALLKHPQTYEHMDPKLVGNSRRVLVSELSGISNLIYKIEEMNLDIELNQTNPETRKILSEIKEMENDGYQFEGAEGSFELLLRKAFNGYSIPFQLEGLRIILEMKEDTEFQSEVVVKMRVGDKVVHTAAEGNGPVNAIDNALRKALESFYPEIKDMKLTDYKVRVLEGNSGTGSVVRVLIETQNGHNSWGTVGVSSNIIEASWQALVDSLAYGLLKEKKKPL